MNLDYKALLKWDFEKFWHPTCDHKAKTAKGWHTWECEKRKNKFAFFMSDTLPDKFNDIFYWPFVRVSRKLKTLWQGHPSIKITSLDKGYAEVDSKMLYGMFQLLVDFVEIENAHMMIWSDSRLKQPKWYTTLFKEWRDPSLGIEYCKWGANLDNPNNADNNPINTRQAEAAREILKLYNWWVNVRPNRLDPSDASGYSAHFNTRAAKTKQEDGFDSIWASFISERDAALTTILDETNRIEQKYTDEDTAMLIRLITVRQNLWT